MAIVLLDSAVIIGFLDRSDALHQAADKKIRELVGNHTIIISVITYAEILMGVRLGHHDKSGIEGFHANLVDTIVNVDEEIAEFAAELRGHQKSLQMPDALILATAELYPANNVITGDQHWRKVAGINTQIEMI